MVNYYKDKIIISTFLLQYEGDFINGNIKEYNEEGNLIFDGGYLNGKRNGKGKEYDSNGRIKFEGEYLNGEKCNGIEHIRGKLEYDIEYKNCKKWNSKIYDNNGKIIYELIDGCGTIIECFHDNLISYIGEYKDGIRNGKGKEFEDDNKLIYEGEYFNGVKHGKGRE